MVKIRLRRMGTKKRPYFRVVVADSRSPRDGRFIENIGKYQPMSDPSVIEIDEERALHWLGTGAQASDPVRVLLQKVGIWEKFRPGETGRIREAKPPKKRTAVEPPAQEPPAAEEPPAAKEASEPEEASAPEPPTAEAQPTPEPAPAPASAEDAPSEPSEESGEQSS